MKSFYQKKIVFIIGGSEGIGLSTAQELAVSGAHVIVASRNPDKLQGALVSLETKRQNGEQVLATASLDVADPEATTRQLESLIVRYGTPDILINYAGFAHPGYLEDLSVAELRRMMDLNYFGAVHAVKAVLPALRNAKKGYIVNVSSMAGYLGVFGYAGYCASKYAVIGFSEALRHELRPYGITVSVLCPPNTRTPGFDKENKIKPKEILEMEMKAGAADPGDVARAMLRALPRKPFLIHPTWNSRLIYQASRILPAPIKDYLMRRP